MKYLPTVNLWDRSIHTALVSGQLKLQCGQWVKCGPTKPSRFVRIKYKGGPIMAVHPNGSTVSVSRFQEAVKCW